MVIENMKVLLLLKYPRKGASTRLRSLQYLPLLQAAGFEVKVSSLFDEEYLDRLYQKGKRSIVSVVSLYLRRLNVLRRANQYDLIWIEKEIFPYVPATAERILKMASIPYVVDYDDAIFHNYDLSTNPVIRYVLGAKIDAVMRHSTCVVAGNQYLAARAWQAGAPRVDLIPTVVDLNRYLVRDTEPGKPVVIGWIGSPSTQKYVLEIKQALICACKRYDATLRLVGATTDMAEAFKDIRVEILPWAEDTEAALIRQMDVGIMPLPDGPWEKGKCGYKLIQYMACAVPVIASPVGVNIVLVDANGSGLLAHSEDEWKASLIALLDSSMLRAKKGLAGRDAVEKIFSLQRQAPELVRVLKESQN